MELTQKTVGSVVVVAVAEARIDARSAPELKEQIGNIIIGGQRQIVLDLSAVTFVDSSGLGAIASSYKALEENKGLAIFGARDAVRNLFRLTRLDRVVPVCGSEEEAVAALKR